MLSKTNFKIWNLQVADQAGERYFINNIESAKTVSSWQDFEQCFQSVPIWWPNQLFKRVNDMSKFTSQDDSQDDSCSELSIISCSELSIIS